VLIAHRTVREIALLVRLSVEEVTHELEGYVLCAPSSAAVPLPRCVRATLRGVDSPPRSGLPSDHHTSDCTPTVDNSCVFT
jgi:hypothetical protein